MIVSEEVKNAYKSGSHQKILKITFPDLNYEVPENEVYYESMTLDEAVFDSDSFEVIGCIASQFEVQIRDTGENLKDEHVVVTISLSDIEDSEIPLFDGYVDSVDREAQKKMQKFTAYDALYSRGNLDVAEWYNNLTFPITLYNLRNSLFDFIEVEQEDTSLPNDSIIIHKEYSPNTLKAINIIKSLCQINGCFGTMGRENTFCYRFIDTTGESESVSFYRSMDYKDYTVNPIDKLTIRQTTEDTGISIGSGDNEYIIQGNMFTYNLEPSAVFTIATNIYPYLRDIEYIPFEASNNGYPWIEVGDNCILDYSVYDFDSSTSSHSVYKDVTVVVMKRAMKGIQNLIDEYSAEGKELQREFISDTSADLDVLQQTVENIQKQMSTEITTYRNPYIITIADGDTADIADLVYQSSEGNTILFHEEVSMEVEATETNDTTYTENDVLATVRYYVNGYRMPTHISEGLLREGKHILSLMQFWEAGEKDTNRVQAKLTVEGGNVTIQRLRANAYITVKQSDYNDVSIAVTHDPDKRVYELGDSLDFTGMVVSKINLSDDTPIADITSKCVFTPAEWTVVTSTDLIDVLITYTERNELGELKTYETHYYLSTQYLTSISVESEPTKNEYFIGDTLNLAGIKVMADYIDGTTKDVTNSCTYTPNTGHTFTSSNEGEIIVSYTERGITETTSTAVAVQEVVLTQLKVTHLPNDTSFRAGETLNYSGVEITGIYNNGTRRVLTNQCTFDPANGSLVTNGTSSSVLVEYKEGQDEGSTTFDINIATFEGIEVTQPTKSSYEVGETLDYSGSVVTAKWSDGHTEDVTNQSTFNPANGSTATTESGSVEVNYTFQGETYTDTFELDIYEFTGIEVTKEPDNTSYWLGDEADYSGIVVSGVYSNDTTEDVTSGCTFNPANGTVTTSLEQSEVTVTYTRPKTGRTYSTSFAIEVKEPQPVLKYLEYTTNVYNRTIRVTGLNVSEIAEDNLRNLTIPQTYTDPESGMTFTLLLDGDYRW